MGAEDSADQCLCGFVEGCGGGGEAVGCHCRGLSHCRGGGCLRGVWMSEGGCRGVLEGLDRSLAAVDVVVV